MPAAMHCATSSAITLAVLGSSLRARLRAARFKALVMAALGLWVLGRALWQAGTGEALPHAPTMGVVGLLALVVNLKVPYFVEHQLALAELARLRHPGDHALGVAGTDAIERFAGDHIEVPRLGVHR